VAGDGLATLFVDSYTVHHELLQPTLLATFSITFFVVIIGLLSRFNFLFGHYILNFVRCSFKKEKKRELAKLYEHKQTKGLEKQLKEIIITKLKFF
jgi:hypothetical protein